MSSATTLSRARVEFLLHAPWPTLATEVDAWLKTATEGEFTDPSVDVRITPVTVNVHEGMVAGFSWFASYPGPMEVIEAHDELRGLITTLLGVPSTLEREDGHSGYWVTSKFAIETYAHDISERGGVRPLESTLQVNVADATLAASQEAIARRSL
ncbi:hypothetical protein [Microbacterium foliorum]|uniref:hypothetical protein n=1 Tax=Microbacterium foliorum TaxID=104336 RepID=UPI001D362462|nr:hypothetical protein [Microbacterium foliorum]CAH0168455.1 hypothetical protein SRABI03_01187 [Microbacterium foliorum]CAH0191833.1 hypothetical protein SRABI44_01706 [Microbacterium foliorum]